jgi:hypothetical protein
MIAFLAALIAGFVLLLWVFVRKSWTALATQPASAAKLGRLRAAMKTR